jgi:CBS domain-containing protein
MAQLLMPRYDAIFDTQTGAGQALVQERARIHRAIAAASDQAGLARATDAIFALVHRVVEQAQAAEPMTLLISALNDVLTKRVIELCCGAMPPGALRWCWISLGSEGRQEQTLSSDQDNGIIFADAGAAGAGAAAEIVRARLLPLARRINAALDACGFPLCSGQIMAGNPEWCLSLREWRERFSTWVLEGDPQALLNASIFFDFRPLHGAMDLAGELTGWLAVEASTNSRFLFQMAANAQRRKVPLSMLHRFVVDKNGPFAGTIDLKVNVATLFVDAARIYGLACGVHASNTADRLRLAAASRRLHPDDVEAWINAFYFIQMLRLKNQHRSHVGGTAMHNHIDPNRLDQGDRRALLDALLQARSLQNRLALDYPGSR